MVDKTDIQRYYGEMTFENHNLTDGVGKCSAPVFDENGDYSHVCNKEAYSKQTEYGQKNVYTAHVPFLACPEHGGAFEKLI